MLCDSCKQREATVHSVTIINGVKQEHYLCPECANAAQFKLPSLFDMLGDFQPSIAKQSDCTCGKSFAAFKQSGLLGCPDCYTAYRNRLMPIIKQMQGGRIRHVGRTPENVPASAAGSTAPVSTPAASPVSELDRLRQELQAAVKAEKYERAAELRDRIRALESEEEAQ